MLRNYLKIATRNIWRHKMYSSVNIIGLSLGLCTCIAIYVIINHEFSFDNFHPGKERIYRVMGDVTESTGDKLHFGRVAPAVSLQGRNALTGMESIAGIIPFNAPVTIPNDNEPAQHFDSRLPGTHFTTTGLAEQQYFTIFKYEWLAGSPREIKAPFTVVLTANRARQYFGNSAWQTMIGRQIIYEDSLIVTVAGIIKDWDKNTDLAFTDFISFSTIGQSFLKNRIHTGSWKQSDMSAWVFTKLTKGITPIQMNGPLNALIKSNTNTETKVALWLEPLADIHFDADIIENPIRTAHRPALYGLITIAVFILVLAIVNFINLSTAQSMRRARETGIRKVLGSSRRQIIFQFLGETFLFTSVAAALAIALVNPVLNLFRTYIPADVSFRLLQPSTIIFLLLVVVITALLAGLYPARVLSAWSPAFNLKPGAAQKRTTFVSLRSQGWLRKSLVVFQFAVSLVFIAGSIVIAWQLRYTREKDPGFTAEAIITMETPRGESRDKRAPLVRAIEQIPGVKQAALQWLTPMTDNPRGMQLKLNSSDKKDMAVTQVAGNENFIPLYNIKILAGRNLLPADSVTEFVINETLAKMTGAQSPADAIGKILYWNDKPYPVTGVVADFHTRSFHDPITPLCIINRPDREAALAIKLSSVSSSSVQTTLSSIEKIWKQFYPAAAFDYRFYDESLALLYEKDQQTAWLINTAAMVAIFISCMGLFGLALFTAQKRAKEISIRKILGASTAGIAAMLSKEFVILVIVALLIATPVAWYFMNAWLQGFVYRIHISGWVFVLAGLAMVVITLLTISVQSLKASIVNPIKALRSE